MGCECIFLEIRVLPTAEPLVGLFRRAGTNAGSPHSMWQRGRLPTILLPSGLGTIPSPQPSWMPPPGEAIWAGSPYLVPGTAVLAPVHSAPELCQTLPSLFPVSSLPSLCLCLALRRSSARSSLTAEIQLVPGDSLACATHVVDPIAGLVLPEPLSGRYPKSCLLGGWGCALCTWEDRQDWGVWTEKLVILWDAEHCGLSLRAPAVARPCVRVFLNARPGRRATFESEAQDEYCFLELQPPLTTLLPHLGARGLLLSWFIWGRRSAEKG